jgi:hypothetical protein
MTAYYNEIDPYAAQWLRNLIAAGDPHPIRAPAANRRTFVHSTGATK